MESAKGGRNPPARTVGDTGKRIKQHPGDSKAPMVLQDLYGHIGTELAGSPPVPAPGLVGHRYTPGI